MMIVRCYLAPSRIEGLGVFCHHDIAKGENVWRHEAALDHSIPYEALMALEPHAREFIERYGYPDPDHPGAVILESDEGRFMNHSDAPNLDFSDGVHGYALVDIPAGTELTCDYAGFVANGEVMFQPSRHRVGVLHGVA